MTKWTHNDNFIEARRHAGEWVNDMPWDSGDKHRDTGKDTRGRRILEWHASLSFILNIIRLLSCGWLYVFKGKLNNCRWRTPNANVVEVVHGEKEDARPTQRTRHPLRAVNSRSCTKRTTNHLARTVDLMGIRQGMKYWIIDSDGRW